jgi:myo-inositol catabolism protein IolS
MLVETIRECEGVMEYRKLGNTGYDVSSLGFGTWQLGGKRWREVSERESVRLLEEAHDLGVNIFDAAVVYGQYRDGAGVLHSRSQELLGKAFVAKRSSVIYCVKLGQFDEYTHRSDYTPHRLVEQLTQSLKRLKTDYLDICLVHAPTLADVESGRAISVVQTLQSLGVVKAVGYSFENEPRHLEEALKQPIDAIMLQYNLLDRDCGELLTEAERRGVGVLVGGPLKRGYLTGEYRSVEDLPSDDDYWNWNRDKNLGKVQALLCRIQEELRQSGSPRNLRRDALQFVLKQRAVASAVVGHRAISEVRENLDSTLPRRALVVDSRRVHVDSEIGKIASAA